jgi:hypothetical protein
LSDFNAIWYVVRLWCPELIPDIEQFVAYFVLPTIYTLKMKVRFEMRGYTNLFTNTVAIPDHNRLVVKRVFPIEILSSGSW